MDAIDFDVPCSSCGYNLRGLPLAGLVCPECGAPNLVRGVDESAPDISEADIRIRFDVAEFELLFLGGLASVLALAMAWLVYVAAGEVLQGGRILWELGGCLFVSTAATAVVFGLAVAAVRTFARRSEPAGVSATCLLSYAVCYVAVGAATLVLVLGPFFLAPQHALQPANCCSTLAGGAIAVAVLFLFVRPWVRRVRERLFESQRSGLLRELRGQSKGGT